MDGSVSNDAFNFQPTAADGTVADANACSYVFNAKDVNQIVWMEPDPPRHRRGHPGGRVDRPGVGAERHPHPDQRPGPPPRTVYGCANVPPKRTGITITFVQRFNKKVLEYVTTDFRGLSAHNLSTTGKHLTQKGIRGAGLSARENPHHLGQRRGRRAAELHLSPRAAVCQRAPGLRRLGAARHERPDGREHPGRAELRRAPSTPCRSSPATRTASAGCSWRPTCSTWTGPLGTACSWTSRRPPACGRCSPARR